MGYEKMKTNRISPSNLKSVKDKLISTKCTAPLWERYHSGKIPIIPDIKSKSPGEGDLLRGRNPAVIAKSLQHAGAPVISVVTESEHYGGSLELLEQIVKATSVPILRKDFITTREQLLESAGAGANGVLLIASMLERKRLLKLIEQAITLDLEPLVETHNEAEIIAIKEFKLTFMGINNRNIIEWEMDNGNVNNTERLAGLVGQQVKTDYKNRLDCPPTLIVSESSIASQQDVLRAGVAGAHAVLVGTVIQKPKILLKCIINLATRRGIFMIQDKRLDKEPEKTGTKSNGKVRVKICGLTNWRDVDLCIRAGVHMVGFVVEYPIPVSWNLTRHEAKKLICRVHPFVSSCIVTGGRVENVLRIVDETCPNVVQLHYKETLEETNEIAKQLKLRGIKTIKALSINDKGNCDFEINDPLIAINELCKTQISAILVDSYTSSMPGGTGVTVSESKFKSMQKESSLPVILAGGLNPTNISQIVCETSPFAVDVLTGVEREPGIKDPEKIRMFMDKVQHIG